MTIVTESRTIVGLIAMIVQCATAKARHLNPDQQADKLLAFSQAMNARQLADVAVPAGVTNAS